MKDNIREIRTHGKEIGGGGGEGEEGKFPFPNFLNCSYIGLAS